MLPAVVQFAYTFSVDIYEKSFSCLSKICLFVKVQCIYWGDYGIQVFMLLAHANLDPLLK